MVISWKVLLQKIMAVYYVFPSLPFLLILSLLLCLMEYFKCHEQICNEMYYEGYVAIKWEKKKYSDCSIEWATEKILKRAQVSVFSL